MASLDNLYTILASQIEHFGGFGLPMQNYEGSSGGNGLATEKYNERPLFTSKNRRRFTGRKMGKLKIDENTKEIYILRE